MTRHKYEGMCIGGVLDGTRIGEEEAFFTYRPPDHARALIGKAGEETRYRYVEYELVRGGSLCLWVAFNIDETTALRLLVDGYRREPDKSVPARKIAGG